MKRWQAVVQVGVVTVLSARKICRIIAFCDLHSFAKEACLTRKPGTGRIVDHGKRRLKSRSAAAFKRVGQVRRKQGLFEIR
jgi:hypothetical protein